MDVGSKMECAGSKGRRVLSLLWLFWLLPLNVFAGNGQIVLVADDRNPVHQRFIKAFREQLPSMNVIGLPSDSAGREAMAAASLIVSVGTRAARSLDEMSLQVPIINSLVTEVDGQRLSETGDQGRRTWLYINQPPARLLALVKSALPERVHITVALGPSSQRAQGPMQQGCNRLALQCDTVIVQDEAGIEQALQRAADSDRVLLVLPDAQVVNAGTARNLILGAYRRNVALVGYSRALVKAGALMAVYSTPEQLGEDAAGVARQVLSRNGAVMPASRYPARYAVSVNYQLAHALRLNIDSESALAQAIHKGEQND